MSRTKDFPAMPYGIVMATGGTAQVAGFIDWHEVALALTAIAIAQAIAIPGYRLLTPDALSLPHWRFGWFTVALGLAVIAQNLHGLAPATEHGVLALAWLATLLCVGWRVALALRVNAHVDGVVDGTWFLAPAALLGDASATATAANVQSQWIQVAVAACLAGVVGYVIVIIASAFRLHRRGLKGSPLAPWWISAGCGGLAAAALGEVSSKVPNVGLVDALNLLLAAMWAIGTLSLIAVLMGCVHYAWRRPRGPWARVWIPVFSMAVYASGTERLAELSGLAGMPETALAMVAVTLALWAINSALFLWRLP